MYRSESSVCITPNTTIMTLRGQSDRIVQPSTSNRVLHVAGKNMEKEKALAYPTITSLWVMAEMHPQNIRDFKKIWLTCPALK